MTAIVVIAHRKTKCRMVTHFRRDSNGCQAMCFNSTNRRRSFGRNLNLSSRTRKYLRIPPPRANAINLNNPVKSVPKKTRIARHDYETAPARGDKKPSRRTSTSTAKSTAKKEALPKSSLKESAPVPLRHWSQPMKKSGCVLTLFPNAVTGLLCPAIRILIGSKPNASCCRRPVRAKQYAAIEALRSRALFPALSREGDSSRTASQ